MATSKKMTIENGNTVHQVCDREQKLRNLVMALFKHETPEIIMVQFLLNSGYAEDEISKTITELKATENLWNFHVS
jgi:hypothetical protein